MQSGATHCMIRLAGSVRRQGLWTIIAAPFTSEQKAEIEGQGIPVEAVRFLPLRARHAFVPNIKYALLLIPHLFRLLAIIRRNQIDIVHVNEVSDLLGVAAARLSGRPCVMHVRANLDPRLISSGMLLAARLLSYLVGALVQKVIVPSHSVQAEIADRLPGFARRVAIVNDVGFDVREFHSGVNGSGVRRELMLADDAPVVLLVSKLAIVKGHLVFLDAAALVAGHNPDAVFLDVGGVMTDHHREAEAIRGKARAIAQRARVLMLGYRRDVPELVAACDIFVHCPIYPDPFPTVVPQAMMMRKAVIGSRIGGISEQIADGVNGLLVEPGDPAALGKAIRRLLDDPSLRQRLAAAAETEARGRYLPAAQASAQIAHYAAILGRNLSPQLPSSGAD